MSHYHAVHVIGAVACKHQVVMSVWIGACGRYVKPVDSVGGWEGVKKKQVGDASVCPLRSLLWIVCSYALGEYSESVVLICAFEQQVDCTDWSALFDMRKIP